MKPTFIQSFLYLAAAGIKSAEAYGCNADNCARAITGTAVKIPMSVRQADCSKFMGAMGAAPVVVTSTTVSTIVTTSTAGTKTETVTEEEEEQPVSRASDDKGKLRRRYGDSPEEEEKPAVAAATTTTTTTPTVAPKPASTSAEAIPSYASACGGPARYSSVCNCWGIKEGAAAATTTTVVVTQTTTSVVKFTAVVQKLAVVCSKTQEKCDGTCKNIFTDVSNCGACGVKCKDGATCVNGVCSDPSCNDVAEWQCDNLSKEGCNGASEHETFCMKGIKASFCTSFANLPLCPQKEEDGCKTDADCTKGQVCGHIACCGWNICIKPHYPDDSGSAAKSSSRRLFKRENKLKLRKLAQED
ncbi:hypothetical protein TWF718_006106 [Orbilia javanica]|uniref:Uncharacterized protein n=1 Tax=Orbilia javanica TaxID=47235 RepID=A0AAN8MVV5_9PEZI